MFKALIKLIRSFIWEDHYKDLMNGLYVSEKLPKTYGTQIKRSNKDG